MALVLGLMGIFAYRMAETCEHWKEMKRAGDVPHVELVWECTNVGFSLVALVLTIVEIAKYAGDALTPFLMLAMHVVKLTLALANLGLDVVVYLQRSEKEYSIVGLAIDCGLLAVTLATLTYTVITFRRVAKYDAYSLTDDVKGGNQFELGNNVQVFATGTPSRTPRGFGVAVDTSYQSQTTSLHQSPLKSDIDKAVGAEFGWGSGDPTTGQVERTGSFVRSSQVPSHKAYSAYAVARSGERGLVAVEEGLDEEDGKDEEDDATVRGSLDARREPSGHRREVSEEDTRALLREHEWRSIAPFQDQSGH